MTCVQTALAAPLAVLWPCARTCFLNRKTRASQSDATYAFGREDAHACGYTAAEILADHRGPDEKCGLASPAAEAIHGAAIPVEVLS